MPATLATVAFVALCATEAGLAASLLTHPGRRWPLLACAGFVAAVSVSPLLQLLTGSDAACGCGLPGTGGGATASVSTLGRNAGIVFGCLLFRPHL